MDWSFWIHGVTHQWPEDEELERLIRWSSLRPSKS
ncbi:unnamed protein product [Brassica oleracea]